MNNDGTKARRGRKRAQNEVRLIFPSHSVNESYARSAAAVFVSQINPTLTELSDIKCAVSEAVTNCIVHGYRDTLGTIYITMRLYENREFRIEIKDKGCGIPNITEAMQPLYTTDKENERSGMGFTIMENFMDSLKVSSGKSGTKVVMSKKLAPLPTVIK
ncbi:MAG: anti-sigma F factor [Clostridia bacterium]|nr:anti-sigma F factor [Clostridia bacterium]